MIKKMLGNVRRSIKEPALKAIYEFLMSPSKHFSGRRLFGAHELALVHRALLNQNLFGVDGKMVGEFEKQFAQTYGVSYAVASTSGTAAIHTALAALDINPGDEVITAPITDLGTIIPILNQGGIPVFADIDRFYNMDPLSVEPKITGRTKAIIVVHLFGNPCEMDAMVDVARRHKIPLIEDCSQAHMTEYKGRPVGTIGDIGCFSFQQSKHMTTGDGGMTITNNNAYYERMKLFVDKGFARKGWGPRAYVLHGQNYRMNELTAAVGIAQLKKVQETVRRRNALGSLLSKLLMNTAGLVTPPITQGAVHSYWMYPLFYRGTNLEQFAAELNREGIYGALGYTVKPIYLCAESLTKHQTYGNSQYPFTWKDVTTTHEYKEGLCPKAEEALKHLFCISIHESMTMGDIERMAAGIRKSCERMGIQQGLEKQEVPVSELNKPGRQPVKNNIKTRVAIIGCGQMGKWHLDAYRYNPDVEIGAYVDTDSTRAKDFTRHVNAAVYASHLEMVSNEKIDAVSLCTVPASHAGIVLDLLDAGIHVLCEKPLAVSVEEAEAMTKRAAERNKVLLTAFKFRFFDEVVRAKDIMLKGQLGKVLQFRLMFGGHIDMTNSWFVQKDVSGGGIIMDNGPHAFDLLRCLLGEIHPIQAVAAIDQPIPVEDTAQIYCETADKAQGSLHVSWTVPMPSDHYLEIYGTEGTLLLDFQGISYKLKTWSDWKRIPNQSDAKTVFKRQVDHFLNAVQGGEPTLTTMNDGLRAQELIARTYEILGNTREKEKRH